jgi:hypothetical protein
LRDYAGANQHIRSHLSRGTQRAAVRSPSGLGGIFVSAAGPTIRSVWAYTASARHVDKVLARKWRPTFFLLSGAKKVGRHKSGQINGLCLEAPAPNTEKWRFWASKNRHFPPIFSLPILGGDQPGPRGRGEEKTCTAAPLRRSVHSRKRRLGAQSASGLHAIIDRPRIARIPRIKQYTKMVEKYGESTDISELNKRFLTTKGPKYTKEIITH